MRVPVPGSSYLERKRTVVAERLAILEAKKTPEQKEKKAKCLKRTKTGKPWIGTGQRKQ